MMEVESNFGLFPLVMVKKEQQPLGDWPFGDLDQLGDFATMSTNKFEDGFVEDFEPDSNYAGIYSEGNVDAERGWENAGGYANNELVPSGPLQTVTQYIMDSRGSLQETAETLQASNYATRGNINGNFHGNVQNQDSASLQIELTQTPPGQPTWNHRHDQAHIPRNENVCGTLFSLEDVEQILCPSPSIPQFKAELAMSAAMQPGSQGEFQSQEFIAQPLLEDELPQQGHTLLIAPSSMYNTSIAQTSAHWELPFKPDSHLSEQSFHDANGGATAISKIEEILFSDSIEQLPHEQSQSTQTIQCSTLLAPFDDHQYALSSREGSVAHWQSPRTPVWNHNGSISPSPNPQVYMTPEPQFHDMNTHIMIPPFPSPMGFAQPPDFRGMTGNFNANTQPELTNKRKRKAYDAEGKIKVNKVREHGACIGCHARKVSCNDGGVCPSCDKAAGNPELAQQICIRTRLKDVYHGVKDIHLTLDERQQKLVPLLATLSGIARSVNLTVENRRRGYTFQLRLQVKTCASSPSCRWKRLTKKNGIYVTDEVIEAQRYVIVPESLPSIDDYDTFGRKILATSNGSHSGSLTQHLDEFLLAYCKTNSQSKLWGFVNNTLRVASLSRLVAYGFLNLHDGSYDLLDRHTGASITESNATRRYVSETVHDQLRILAARGLVPVEKDVFSAIDELNKLFGKFKNGKIVSGVCVLRLMLLYRDRVVRDSIRLGLPRGGDQHKKRLAKAAFMYERLTVAYGTLCRETTPLLMNWDPEDERNPTPNDVIMTELFARLQPAFDEFCNNKVSTQYDKLFKDLIIEALTQERRVGKKRKVEKVKVAVKKEKVTTCHDC